MSLIKKTLARVQLIALLTLSVFVWTFVLPHEAITAATIQIPAGTRVLLRTIQTLTPKEFKVGDRVNLVVASDVVVDGKVVIKAGDPATGEVTVSKERGIAGQADKLTISVKSVKAVDGTPVIISGTKSVEGEEKMVMAIILALLCLPLILIKGGSASIPEGAQIEAMVAAQTTITVK
ncbi:MAG: hypothetical protein AB1478_09525 [Nitrospirota bacterium]